MDGLIELDKRLWQLSLIGTSDDSYATGYIIDDEKKVLIETGASPSNPAIHEALETLKIRPEELDAVIVTHIHLDHAGGAGLLLEQCPNAELLVHPKGAQHLIDSSRLEASARQVYGPAFEDLFAPIKDIPAERVKLMEDNSSYMIGPDRNLNFHHAEGHALHHFVVMDSQTGSLFTGDAAGMCYPLLQEHYNVDLVLPATTPNQYDPEALESFLKQMLQLKPKRICFTHFGCHEDPDWVAKEVLHWLPLFSTQALEHYRQHHRLESLKEFLLENILDVLQQRGVPKDNEALNKLIFDTDLNAQGIAAYAKRLAKNKE